MKTMKTRVWLLLMSCCIVLSLSACSGSEQTTEDTAVTKAITVDVIVGSEKTTFSYSTDAEMLRDVLEDNGLIAGEESEYGLFVKTVNGVTVNEANQEWWCFTKSGEALMTGVDSTPIADGDHFEITLTVGY